MEYKRCNSSRTTASISRSPQLRTSATSTPVRSATPMRTPTSARSGASSARRTLTGTGTGSGALRSVGLDGASPRAKGPGLPRPIAYKRSGTATSGGQVDSGNDMSVVSSRSAIGDSPKGKRGAHKPAVAKTGGNGRVNVYARVRAFSPAETADNQHSAVHLSDNKVEVVVSPKSVYTFMLDGCFSSTGSPSDEGFASQSSVFDAIGRPLAENALAGYNAAIMVYGQTGSGKTYTMFGPPKSLGTEEQGLVPRVCNMIFERADACLQKGITCRVCVSMLEVYLEDVFDLFSNRKQVTVRKDYLDNSFHVVGAKSIPVRQYKDVEELLQRAEALRTFAATAIHARSSRAHALFQLELYTTFESTDIAPRTAKILLADLAGCERIKLAQTETGIPFEEARNINLSLLSLGSCIEAVTMRKGSSQNIPEFRNSTLTKLLKEYLGGNSVSSIVVTVGPSVRDARLSVQSLRFADRAMKVVTHAKINTVKPITELDDADGSEDKVREAYNKKKEALHVEFQVQSELQKLQNKITILECQLMNSVDDEVVARLQEEISTYQKSLADADLELQQQRRVLYDSEVMLEEQLKELNTRMQEMIEENEETTENLLAECRKKHTERLEVEQKRHEEEVDVLLKSHEFELERINQLLQDSDTKCAELTTTLFKTKEDLRKTDGLVDEMQMALEELGEASKATETELYGYVEQLRSENSRLSTAIDTLRQQLKESEASVEDRDNRLKEHETSLDTLRQQLKESEASVEDRDNRLKEHETSLDTLRQQLKESETTVVVLTADLKQLKEKMFIDQADLKERIAFLEVELKRCEEKGAYYSALVDEMQAELHCANERVAAMSDQVQNMEVRVFDVCGYMFEAFSVKCQDTVSAFASFTKGVTEDLTKGTTERLRLLAEVVELRSSTVARKAATQRRASAVSSLVQSAQEILSKIADEVEDVDNFSDRSAVVASFVNSPKESWGADLSPRFTEESLTC